MALLSSLTNQERVYPTLILTLTPQPYGSFTVLVLNYGYVSDKLSRYQKITKALLSSSSDQSEASTQFLILTLATRWFLILVM